MCALPKKCNDTSLEKFTKHVLEECPKIYNSWRAIKFTEKGKKVGNSEEWDNFRNFYNDVRPTYAEGLSLHRKIYFNRRKFNR